VIVAEGGPRTYDVKAVATGAVQGRVVRDGKPAAGVRVRAFDGRPLPKGREGEEPQTTDVDVAADGSFRVDCAFAGPVVVVAYVPSKADPRRAEAQSTAAKIDVKAGPATELAAPLDIPARK